MLCELLGVDGSLGLARKSIRRHRRSPFGYAVAIQIRNLEGCFPALYARVTDSERPSYEAERAARSWV